MPNIAAHVNAHWSGYVLLVVYVGSQIASTLLMSATMDKTQRTIFLVLPLAFIFFLAHFPTGLVLYWVTTNLWTVGQGIDHAAAGAEAAAAGEALVAHAAEGRAPPAPSPTAAERETLPAPTPAAAAAPAPPRSVSARRRRASARR